VDLFIIIIIIIISTYVFNLLPLLPSFTVQPVGRLC